MSNDARYAEATRLAADLAAKAEELSTAIYQAGQMGYAVKIRLDGMKPIGGRCFLGNKQSGIKATIPFDIGERGL